MVKITHSRLISCALGALSLSAVASAGTPCGSLGPEVLKGIALELVEADLAGARLPLGSACLSELKPRYTRVSKDPVQEGGCRRSQWVRSSSPGFSRSPPPDRGKPPPPTSWARGLRRCVIRSPSSSTGTQRCRSAMAVGESSLFRPNGGFGSPAFPSRPARCKSGNDPLKLSYACTARDPRPAVGHERKARFPSGVALT